MQVYGSELLLDLFQKNGIDTIFCSPGSEWVPVWDELLKRSEVKDKSIRYINCRHEELAVSMAWGYTKSSGRLPAVLLHAGVGPLHAAMAIRNAYHTQAPMLICSSRIYKFGNSTKASLPGSYWINQLSDPGGTEALINPYVKWCNTVNSEDSMLDAVYRGCKIAQTPSQGPVLLSVDGEVLLKRFEVKKIRRSTLKMGFPEIDPTELESIAHQLLNSKKPMIITEYAGEKSEAVEKIVELAELLSIPVYESVQPLYANFPKDHPLYLGHDTSKALEEADLIFVIGASTPWFPTSKAPTDDAKFILLDQDTTHDSLTYWGYRADWMISSDIANYLAALIAVIRRQVDAMVGFSKHLKTRLEQCRAKHAQLSKQWEAEKAVSEIDGQISLNWLLSIISNNLPESAIIVEETITHSLPIHRHLAQEGRFIRACMGGLGMGIGVAAGTKLAFGKNPVIFIVGDGTFNYNPVMAGLGVCQEYGLPLLIIILNNGGYRSIKQRFLHHRSRNRTERSAPYLGVEIKPSPDYKQIAGAFDAYSARINHPDQFDHALKKALHHISSGKSALLDIVLSK